jgi:hypothetical protein
LIQELILDDFRFIRNDVTELTTGMPLYHSILSGIALGDGQTHSAFKRANVANDIGMKAIDELCEIGIIRLEKSKKVFTSWDENESVSNKLYFTSPFLRFWFAFVSPIFKGIRDGDYKEVKERFINRKNEFIELIFMQLSHELIKKSFTNIKEISSYWDNNIHLDIYTKSPKIIAGFTRFSNSKMKKSDFTRLQESCKKANIEVDSYILVSKKGFSSELKSLKSEKLKLYTVKNFKKLIL